MTSEPKARRGLGRPPKFAEPSRVVTVTLPESTLRDLEVIDADRARAIVEVTRLGLAPGGPDPARAVELVPVGERAAVITVPNSQALAAIRGVTLIQMRPGRYLVTLDPEVTLAEIEVALLDSIETADGGGADRELLVQFLDRLRVLRRSERTATRQVIVVAI
jgi:hypothetical protein